MKKMICGAFGIPCMLATMLFGQNTSPTAVIAVNGKTIMNNSVTASKGESIQFVGARSSDADGDALGYKWDFGDGGTSTLANPRHTFASDGKYMVKLIVSDPFLQLPAGPNPDYPNEPAGFRRIAENNFDAMPAANVGGCGGIGAGCFWYYGSQGSIQSDPTSPKSPGKVFQFNYPVGQQCGVGPGVLYAWDTGLEGGGTKMREIYESDWIKIPSRDFENLPTQMKLPGYWGVGVPVGAPASQMYGVIRSPNVIDTSFQLDFAFQGVAHDGITPNAKNIRIKCGKWIRFEIYMKLNTIGQSNGILIVWLDGVITHYYTNRVFIDAQNPGGFSGRTWNPVYGGGCPDGSTKTRSDNLWVDHMYISGIPQ